MADIRIENIYKVFSAKPEKTLDALKKGASKKAVREKYGVNVGVINANLHIEPGQIFVIMGLSGSGKSTLLRMLNRLIEPTEGSIFIDGEDITKMDGQALRKVRRSKLAMVFQNFGLFPHRTVLENVAYPLTIQGIAESEAYAHAQKAITTVGLAGYEASYPDALSGGMQQRVGLARALASDASILLMDEAFSALDPLIRKDMQDELLELQESMKKTIVFITHDLNEALKIGDKIAIMRDGAIIQVGTPEEILMNPANAYVERFIEDAAIGRVLTVRHIMKEPYAILSNRGPRVALQMMQSNGVSDLFVVDTHRHVLGIVSAQTMREARDRGGSILEYMDKEVPVLSPEDSLDEAAALAATATKPMAVVENGRLVGAAVKGAILGGISGSSVGDGEGVQEEVAHV